MKVLFNTQSIGFQIMGGLEIQMLKTKEHLEKLGVVVKLFDPFHDRLEDYDILHVFGSYSYEMVPLARMARDKGMPLVISPVYWRPRFWETAIKAATALLSLSRNGHVLSLVSPPDYLFSLADLILPNSEIEAAHLVRHFKLARGKVRIVPNGVDGRFGRSRPDLFVDEHGLRDFVLFVGAISPGRKNVLELVRAMNGTEIPLVIIGKATPSSAAYYDRCRREAHDNVHFLGHVDHEMEMLASAYAAARVFALPSWAETPGLAALEAELSGCNIVITDRGSTTEYFRDQAIYCRPGSVASIRAAVIEAYRRGKNGALRNRIRENYTWEIVARKTLEAYELVVGR